MVDRVILTRELLEQMFDFAYKPKKRVREPIKQKALLLALAPEGCADYEKVIEDVYGMEWYDPKRLGGPTRTRQKCLLINRLQAQAGRINRRLAEVLGPDTLRIRGIDSTRFELEILPDFASALQDFGEADLHELLSNWRTRRRIPQTDQLRLEPSSSTTSEDPIESYRQRASTALIQTWFSYLTPIERSALYVERTVVPINEAARRKYPRSQHLSDVIAKEDVMVLLGDPGSGKSYSMAGLAARMASAHDSPVIPVFIPLKPLGPPFGLNDLCQEAIARIFGATHRQPDQVYSLLLKSGCPFLFIFDGLDELLPDDRRRALYSIAGCHGNGHRAVITCRTADYADQLGSAPSFLLSPFSREQAVAYLNSFVGERGAGAIRAQLDCDPFLINVIHQPFFLSKLALLLAYAPDQELPPTRGQLMNRFLNLVARARSAETSEEYDERLQRQKDRFLERIAFTLVSRSPVGYDQLPQVAHLGPPRWQKEFPDKQMTQLLMLAYRERLLRTPRQGQVTEIEFSHQIIRDMFAARSLHTILLAALRKHELDNTLCRYVASFGWDSVLHLVVGIASKPLCEQIMCILIDKAPELAAACFPLQAPSNQSHEGALVRLIDKVASNPFRFECSRNQTTAPHVFARIGTRRAIMALMLRNFHGSRHSITPYVTARLLYGFTASPICRLTCSYLREVPADDPLWRELISEMPSGFKEAIPVLLRRLSEDSRLSVLVGRGDKRLGSVSDPDLWLLERLYDLGEQRPLLRLKEKHLRVPLKSWGRVLLALSSRGLIKEEDVFPILDRALRFRCPYIGEVISSLRKYMTCPCLDRIADACLDSGKPASFKDDLLKTLVSELPAMSIESAANTLLRLYSHSTSRQRNRLLTMIIKRELSSAADDLRCFTLFASGVMRTAPRESRKRLLHTIASHQNLLHTTRQEYALHFPGFLARNEAIVFAREMWALGRPVSKRSLMIARALFARMSARKKQDALSYLSRDPVNSLRPLCTCDKALLSCLVEQAIHDSSVDVAVCGMSVYFDIHLAFSDGLLSRWASLAARVIDYELNHLNARRGPCERNALQQIIDVTAKLPLSQRSKVVGTIVRRIRTPLFERLYELYDRRLVLPSTESLGRIGSAEGVNSPGRQEEIMALLSERYDTYNAARVGGEQYSGHIISAIETAAALSESSGRRFFFFPDNTYLLFRSAQTDSVLSPAHGQQMECLVPAPPIQRSIVWIRD